jgi:glycerol-3-phosphate cytidylyltransferase
MLESIKYISCIVEYDTEENHRKILDLIQPTMMFKGSDWKEKDIPEWNGEMAIIWHERDHDWSSTNFRKKIYEAERKKRED